MSLLGITVYALLYFIIETWLPPPHLFVTSVFLALLSPFHCLQPKKNPNDVAFQSHSKHNKNKARENPKSLSVLQSSISFSNFKTFLRSSMLNLEVTPRSSWTHPFLRCARPTGDVRSIALSHLQTVKCSFIACSVDTRRPKLLYSEPKVMFTNALNSMIQSVTRCPKMSTSDASLSEWTR